MANGDQQGPPPDFMGDPPNYDIEEMVQITRLEGDLHRLLEQILSIDPNGMMRIELVLHRVKNACVVERFLH